MQFRSIALSFRSIAPRVDDTEKKRREGGDRRGNEGKRGGQSREMKEMVVIKKDMKAYVCKDKRHVCIGREIGIV
jgi:hypothetical protein